MTPCSLADIPKKGMTSHSQKKVIGAQTVRRHRQHLNFMHKDSNLENGSQPLGSDK